MSSIENNRSANQLANHWMVSSCIQSKRPKSAADWRRKICPLIDLFKQTERFCFESKRALIASLSLRSNRRCGDQKAIRQMKNNWPNRTANNRKPIHRASNSVSRLKGARLGIKSKSWVSVITTHLDSIQYRYLDQTREGNRNGHEALRQTHVKTRWLNTRQKRGTAKKVALMRCRCTSRTVGGGSN